MKYEIEIPDSLLTCDGKRYEPTGEYRNPKEGEWYLHADGSGVVQAVSESTDWESVTPPKGASVKTSVKSRPLNRTAEQVRAILRGATQFRVPVDGCVEEPGPYSPEAWLRGEMPKCPFGTIGDELWVRECWAIGKPLDGRRAGDLVRKVRSIWYPADGDEPEWCGRARHARFMPRWASRLTLEIVGVRVERVQEISEEDAKASGCFLRRCACAEMQRKPRNGMEAAFRQTWCHIHGQEFRDMWSSQYGPESWDRNDWVWVVNYRRREA